MTEVDDMIDNLPDIEGSKMLDPEYATVITVDGNIIGHSYGKPSVEVLKTGVFLLAWVDRLSGTCRTDLIPACRHVSIVSIGSVIDPNKGKEKSE